MPSSEPLAGRLSAPIERGLEQFCERLQNSLGDELVSVVLYGWSAEEEYSKTSPDVSVMVVVKTGSIETLDRIAESVRKAVRKFHLAPLVLSADDVRGSTDVFPIKFLGMQRHHKLLCGMEVLAELQISSAHLRLRCEQEIKNLMIRLQQFYLQQGDSPKQIREVLLRAVPTILNDLGVLVELKTDTAPATHDATVEATKKLGLDVEPLRKGLALKRGQTKLKTDQLKALLVGVMNLVRHAAEIADHL